MPALKLLLALAVAKKAVVYVAARTYGIPRLYLKAKRLNHKMMPTDVQPTIDSVISTSFRLPNKIYDTFMGTNSAAASEVVSNEIKDTVKDTIKKTTSTKTTTTKRGRKKSSTKADEVDD